MINYDRKILFIVFVLLLLVLVTCAPNNEKFVEKQAGFWAGLWHGFIACFTFIIGLFTDSVRMYEVNNIGGWYDFGFLIGISILAGSSGGGACKKSKRKKSPREQEWEEIGKKVEEKVRAGVKKWVDESEEEKEDADWKEIGKKVEEKIKRELRNWSEK